MFFYLVPVACMATPHDPRFIPSCRPTFYLSLLLGQHSLRDISSVVMIIDWIAIWKRRTKTERTKVSTLFCHGRAATC